MFGNWLRRLLARKTRPLTNGRRSIGRLPSRRLQLEGLEDRLAPAVDVWIGAVGGLWSVAGNWSLNAPPTAADVATFDTTLGGMDTGSTIDAAFAGSVLGINMTSNYSKAITAQRVLTFGASGLTVSGGTFDLAGSSQTVPVVSGTGTGTVSDSGAAATFTVNNATADTFGGLLTGTNLSLAKTGAGTLTLAQAATYGGSTTVSAGTLTISVADALPVGTALGVTALGASFELGGFNQTVGSVTGTGTVTDSGGAATFTVDNAVADTFAGGLTGNLSLTKSNSRTLILTSGANTYTGTTTVTAGILADGVANAVPIGTALTVGGTGAFDLAGFNQTVVSVTGTGTVSDSGGAATFTVNPTGDDTFAGTLAGLNLSLTKRGARALILTGGSSYGGTTTISSGTLQIGSGGTSGTLGTGDVIDAGTLVFDRRDTIIVSNAISGLGGVTIVGGTVTLGESANAYTGPTMIASGTLSVAKLANGGSPSSLGASTNAAANLEIDGALLYTGTGDSTDRLFGVSNGTIDNSGTGALAFTNTGALTGSGLLTLTGSSPGVNTLTPSLSNTGPSSLTKSGSDTWDLTNTTASTNTGPTTVAAGTLLVDGVYGTVLLDSAVSVTGGTLGGSGTIGGSVTINGGAAINPGTAGTVGTLTVGSLTVNGGTYQADLDPATNTADQIVTAGQIALNPANPGVFSLNILNTSLPITGTGFVLINNQGTGAIQNPPFTNAPEGGTVSINGKTGVYSYLGNPGGNSFTLTVVPGPATHFDVSAPATATAGTAFTFTVTALDQFDSTATGYTGTVHFTSSDSQASLPADSTLTNGVGTFSATLNTAGTQTLTATDTVSSSITGTSNNISVSPATATHFSVSAPATASAATAFSFTVTALDQFNNTATGYTGTVHFTSTDSQAALPADSPLTNGVGTFSATLKTVGTQTLTATDTVTSGITGTSNNIVVSPGTATHFSVSAPATATAGTAFNFTVTALDAGNNTATGYTGTVHFTSSDGQAALPANSPLTNGVGTFSATLKTAGNQTLTATDTVTSAITGTSNAISVSPVSATHFSVSAPATATAGTAFSFTVTARDAFNNTAPSYTGTVHFTSSDGAAMLPADSTLTNGVGTFSATLKTAGNQTLTATDTVNSAITGTSNTIAVSGANATHFTVSAPAAATAGTAFNVTVRALDQFNNTATGYTGTVHFTSTDSQAALPADSPLTNGVGTFSATLKTVGTRTLTATDTVTSGITGTSNNIVVSPGTATHFSVSAPATATAGTAFNFTVTALDAGNNTATGYTGTVHFTSSDGQAALPANSPLTNGVGTFSATLKTAGNQTLTATDTVTSAITGTSNAISVSPVSATDFSVSAPATATAGTAFSFTVTARDQFNNTTPGYAGTVHFTSSDGAATLPADSTLTNGVGTFSATLKTAGNQTLTATDTVDSAITGTSNAIAVSPVSATHFTVSAPATATAGTLFNFTVTALDQFNNTATGYTRTVHFTSTDSQATFPANGVLVNGVGTFGATLRTPGNQTLTATDPTTSSITGTSNAIAVSGATHFMVSAPANATAGTAFSFTVTALDAANNPATGYTGTVHFTSSDSQAVLPANSTFTNGIGTFSATLKTVGNQTLTATDTTTSSITGTSSTITVSGTHFSVSAPASATAGTAFSFTVTALDASNNPVTSYTGTVHFTSSDSAAMLPANTTLTNGVGTFSATLNTAGSQTITATDTTTSSIAGTSGSIAVTVPGVATHFSVSAVASTTAGNVFTFTVTALDANNNTATGYSGTVHFTSSDSQAGLPANSTLTNGVGTFSATLKTAGSQTLTATDTVTSSITGTSNAIAVSAATATHFAVSAPSSATKGTAFSFTVRALDAFNNAATGYTGTVHFTSSDSAATLPANSTLTNGTGTFSATLRTVGNQTLTATDTVTSSLTGTSGVIAVAGTVVTNVHQAWVQQVYLDLLGRPAEAAGLAGWTSALDSGQATYFQVATAIEQSLEYRTDVVEALYQQFLGRPADPTGLAGWVGLLGSGGTSEQVEAGILSSPEFFQKSGGINIGFLNALYQNLFNRNPDATGAAVFNQFLAQGGSREGLVNLILASPENKTDMVQAHYLAYLHRALDPSGQGTWVGYELQGGTDEAVIASILASNEFVADL